MINHQYQVVPLELFGSILDLLISLLDLVFKVLQLLFKLLLLKIESLFVYFVGLGDLLFDAVDLHVKDILPALGERQLFLSPLPTRRLLKWRFDWVLQLVAIVER